MWVTILPFWQSRVASTLHLIVHGLLAMSMVSVAITISGPTQHRRPQWSWRRMAARRWKTHQLDWGLVTLAAHIFCKSFTLWRASQLFASRETLHAGLDRRFQFSHPHLLI